ncbi:unnamed protein product, partial [Brenthis ino]
MRGRGVPLSPCPLTVCAASRTHGPFIYRIVTVKGSARNALPLSNCRLGTDNVAILREAKTLVGKSYRRAMAAEEFPRKKLHVTRVTDSTSQRKAAFTML